ncbi:MAG: hypothetical protein J6B96_01695 [Agathobacter sp.]|nr:hypothetical protein [Agathobacter sp.]
MNKKQYNNVIEHTLNDNHVSQTEDSLEIARAIFNNMGVALPQGNIKNVYEILKSDDYMGWKSCTMQEAQEAADNGIAAIGISKDRIVVLAAKDEEEPVAETVSVMSLSKDISVNTVDGMSYYAYSNGTTTGVKSIFNKPYDPNYPYTLNGIHNNINEEQYYKLLDSYSYELRNDIQFYFTFEEIDSLKAYLESKMYKSSTKRMREQVVNDIYSLASEVISFLPDILRQEWLGKILDTVNIGSTISSLNSRTVKDSLYNIISCIAEFSRTDGEDEGVTVPKSNVVYRISLLKQSPVEGREIKIESSDGLKDIYTIENGTYDVILMTAIANAHSQTLYKIAPDWSYYWE